MSFKNYHLNYRNMEKKPLGEKFLCVMDAAEKKNLLIYQVMAAVITYLDLKEISADEALLAIEEWTGSVMYGRGEKPAVRRKEPVIHVDKNTIDESHVRDAPPPDAKEEKPPAAKPPEKTKEEAPGACDLSKFMIDSKFSDLTGGI